MSNYYLNDNVIKTLWRQIKNTFAKKTDLNEYNNKLLTIDNSFTKINQSINNLNNNFNSIDNKINNIDNEFSDFQTTINQQIIEANQIVYQSVHPSSQEDFYSYVKNDENQLFYLTNTNDDFIKITDKQNHTVMTKYKYFKLNTNQYYKLSNITDQDDLNYYYYTYKDIYIKNNNNYIKQSPTSNNEFIPYDKNTIYYIKFENGYFEEIAINNTTDLINAQYEIYYLENPSYEIVKNYFFDLYKHYYLVLNTPITYKMLNEQLLYYIKGNIINLNVYNSNFNNAYKDFGNPGTSFSVQNDPLAPSIILNLADQSDSTLSYILRYNNSFWSCNHWRIEKIDDDNIDYYFSLSYAYPTYERPSDINEDSPDYLSYKQRYVIGKYNTKTQLSYYKTIEIK